MAVQYENLLKAEAKTIGFERLRCLVLLLELIFTPWGSCIGKCEEIKGLSFYTFFL